MRSFPTSSAILPTVSLGEIRKCIPDALAVLVDCVDFRSLQFTVSKSAKTSNKWTLSQLYAEIDLDTLQGDVNLFGTVITFEQPQLLLEIDNPTSVSIVTLGLVSALKG